MYRDDIDPRERGRERKRGGERERKREGWGREGGRLNPVFGISASLPVDYQLTFSTTRRV